MKRAFLAMSLAAVAALAALAEDGKFEFGGCHVQWTGKSLAVGNRHFRRAYEISNGVLRTTSFAATGGVEWQKRGADAASAVELDVEAARAKWSPVGVEGVRIDVKVKASGLRCAELWLFPEMPGVLLAQRHGTLTELKPVPDLARKWETLYKDNAMLGKARKQCDFIAFKPMHVKAVDITCLDQTDIRDNLVVSHERLMMDYDWLATLSATALDCRDVLTGDGLAFVRLAPMPACRPAGMDDFILDGNRGVGILDNGYPLAELVYRGGDAGRQRAVIAFQRALRPYRPGRDGVLLSNTWGAGNHDTRINQSFLLKEIEAGAKIGVDVIQIDDGWESGRTMNSERAARAGKDKVWNGYWATDPDFWKEDRERFPDGLDLIVKAAAQKGMRFGLWFGPDSSDEAANWEKDAACLLDFHRRLGIDYFKLDSMKLPSQTALKRSRMMFDRMLAESGGAMVFDLDATAEVRPGFWGMIDVGPVFVENRYTRKPVYWPHHTLKNLWDLAHLVDPVRLRMEFNNPDTNHDIYKGSPLGHGNYRPDTLFAVVMAASPLAWMELSDVSEKSVAVLAPLVARWKAERARWHGGTIHPVANRPDGVSWTGFVSEAADGGGYALLFRELSEDAAFTLDLRPVFGKSVPLVENVIGGRGEAHIKDGRLTVNVPEKLDFVWVKLAGRSAEGAEK